MYITTKEGDDRAFVEVEDNELFSGELSQPHPQRLLLDPEGARRLKKMIRSPRFSTLSCRTTWTGGYPHCKPG